MEFIDKFLHVIQADTPFIVVNDRGQRQLLTQSLCSLVDMLAKIPQSTPWAVCRWTAVRGMELIKKPAGGSIDVQRWIGFSQEELKAMPPTPPAFLAKLSDSLGQKKDVKRIILLPNFDKCIVPSRDQPDMRVVQLLEDLYDQMPDTDTHLVIVSSMPFNYDRLATKFVHVDYQLPSPAVIKRNIQSMQEAINQINTSKPAVQYTPQELDQLVENARGLTVEQLTQALAIQGAESQKFNSESLFAAKKEIIEANTPLKIVQSTKGFESLGGLQHLKKYTKRLLTTDRSKLPKGVLPRGIVLVGVPGAGKSAFAKALGYETKRLTIMLDMSSMRQGIVGATESTFENALHYIDAMSPSVVFIDEIEKMLGGGDSTANDGGINNRILQRYLTWASDRTSDSFVVATSNDISRLPPELFRSGRVDAIFFVDTPQREEKNQIWQYYGKLWSLPVDLNKIQSVDEGWTGADIEQCCRTAILSGIDVLEAARTVIPTATQAEATVKSMRERAANRYLSASYEGKYLGEGVAAPAATKVTKIGVRNIIQGKVKRETEQ